MKTVIDPSLAIELLNSIIETNKHYTKGESPVANAFEAIAGISSDADGYRAFLLEQNKQAEAAIAGLKAPQLSR